jgi:hypothetical protein
VRDLFARATGAAPCVLFFDEVLAGQGGGGGGGYAAVEGRGCGGGGEGVRRLRGAARSGAQLEEGNLRAVLGLGAKARQ